LELWKFGRLALAAALHSSCYVYACLFRWWEFFVGQFQVGWLVGWLDGWIDCLKKEIINC